jgi:hypothetical protein
MLEFYRQVDSEQLKVIYIAHQMFFQYALLANLYNFVLRDEFSVFIAKFFFMRKGTYRNTYGNKSFLSFRKILTTCQTFLLHRKSKITVTQNLRHQEQQLDTTIRKCLPLFANIFYENKNYFRIMFAKREFSFEPNIVYKVRFRSKRNVLTICIGNGIKHFECRYHNHFTNRPKYCWNAVARTSLQINCKCQSTLL